MTDTVHVTVTLHPDTIAALAEAMRGPERRGRVVLLRRGPFATRPSPVTLEDIGRAVAGRGRVTIPEVLEAIGIPPERWDRALTMRVGEALRDHGWRKTGRRGSGTRERVYTPVYTPPPPVVG